MKDAMLIKLRATEEHLRDLRAAVKALTLKSVSRKDLRDQAESLADLWVEELRSPLEYRFKIPAATIEHYAEHFKRLHILSRPNNLCRSYLECLRNLLKNWKDELVLPIQQSPDPIVGNAQLSEIIGRVNQDNVSDYLTEAVACAQNNHMRAAIVMGWCAVVDHIQKKLLMLGLDKFNKTSSTMRQQQSGRFKRFNKEFKITTLNELQEVFDGDLLWVLEGMQLIDANQGDRLRACFDYRNQSAHPGAAPVRDVHLIALFSDAVDVVLCNPQFSLTSGGTLP